jgi:hypothetical protein
MWAREGEKNHPISFAQSFKSGFGTETDVRDFAGELVISHDAPTVLGLSFKSFLEIYKDNGAKHPLALNIKSDGLQNQLVPLMREISPEHWFVFDMSVPDALGWIRLGAPTFTRQSEYELSPPYYTEAVGVWLDSFHSDWWSEEVISRHLDAGKKVCVVSPELHKRDPRTVWERMAKRFIEEKRVILCTDFPEQAKDYFRNG